MTKEAYFENLDEIISEKVYLTENLDALDKEIENNHGSIGIDFDVAKQINKNDLRDFFKKLIENRFEQLNKSGKIMDLIFYTWFDEQAGNLNFNFINAGHENLPFGAKLELVDSIDIILSDFLNSKYLVGIPWDELQDFSSDFDDNYERDFKLRVYKIKIYKNGQAQKWL
uniref:hypothetical protein n=1 Tax=Flavobacterium sp. TaxID=239 RepID=UPI00404A99EE